VRLCTHKLTCVRLQLSVCVCVCVCVTWLPPIKLTAALSLSTKMDSDLRLSPQGVPLKPQCVCVLALQVHEEFPSFFCMKTHFYLSKEFKKYIKSSQDIEEVINNDFYSKY